MGKSKGRKYKKKKKTGLAKILAKYPPIGKYRFTAGVPQVMQLCLKYCDRETMSSSTTDDIQVWRLNSLYDPDKTHTGGQPRGMDEIEQLYDRYRVVACKYLVEVIPNTNTGTGIFSQAIISNDGDITDVYDVREAKSSKTILMGHANGEGGKSLSGMVDCAAWKGLKTVRGEDLCSAVVGANAADPLFLVQSFESFNNTTSVSVDVITTLWYYVEFYEPAIPTPST